MADKNRELECCDMITIEIAVSQSCSKYTFHIIQHLFKLIPTNGILMELSNLISIFVIIIFLGLNFERLRIYIIY